jgi:hypothetical protein
MMKTLHAAGVALAVAIAAASISAQSTLVDLMLRHGIDVQARRLDVAFDALAAPTIPVTPGSFATPLAILTTGTGADRIDAAFAFGILAGRSGRAASPQELAAAAQSFVVMITSSDWRTRVAGARVAGRVLAAPWEPDAPRPALPPGLLDGLFAMLNQDGDADQLAAMDALGLIREKSAVTSLIERYRYYRTANKRALAGGALEALARIGDPAAVPLVRELSGDKWAEGKDATALAIAFARERLLHDGSIAVINLALDDRSRRGQARGYLAELGAPVP